MIGRKREEGARRQRPDRMAAPVFLQEMESVRSPKKNPLIHPHPERARQRRLTPNDEAYGT